MRRFTRPPVTKATLDNGVPHSDEITSDPRDYDTRTGYSDMEGPSWIIIILGIIGVITISIIACVLTQPLGWPW